MADRLTLTSATQISFRRAAAADAGACLAIYAPFVTDTAVSFEINVPSAAEFARRIEAANAGHAWFVVLADDTIAGYAYGTPHRARHAYRYSAETSIYMDPQFHGQGLGRRLYRHLLAHLAGTGHYNAYAGISLPNEASEALHRRVGFQPVGTFERVGYKFDTWHDVSWWQRPLRKGSPPA